MSMRTRISRLSIGETHILKGATSLGRRHCAPRDTATPVHLRPLKRFGTIHAHLIAPSFADHTAIVARSEGR